MKLYLVCIVIPKSTSSVGKLKSLSDYVKSPIEDLGDNAFFYGYTADKKMKSMIEEVYHPEHIHIIERKIDDSEYMNIEEKWPMRKFTIISLDDTITIPAPDFVGSFVYDMEDEFMHKVYDTCNAPYNIIKKEYMRPLDLLGYTFWYQIQGLDAEYHSMQMSYGITPEEYGSGMDYNVNKTKLLISVLRDILRSDKGGVR